MDYTPKTNDYSLDELKKISSEIKNQINDKKKQLLDKDRIKSKQELIEEEIYKAENSMKYDTVDWKIDNLPEILNKTELNTSSNKWTLEKQSAYIESLIIGMPMISSLVVSQDSYDRIIILEGNQRIIAINDYMNGLILKGLTRVSELNGTTFSELSSSRQRKFKQVYLRVTILENNKDNLSLIQTIL